MMVGVKSSAFDNRLKLTAEFARTQRVVEQLGEADSARRNILTNRWNQRPYLSFVEHRPFNRRSSAGVSASSPMIVCSRRTRPVVSR